MPARPSARWLLPLLLCLAAVPRAAEDDPRVTALGTGSHAEREAAERELWKLGDEGLPVLRRAAESDDPEVALRAGRLVRLIESGVYPDTPPDLAGQLRSLPNLAPEELARLVAGNAADRVMGPRLLHRAIAATRTRRDAPFCHAMLRNHLRAPLLSLVASGREADALRLLEIAAREGVPSFAEPAAAAFRVEGQEAGLIARLTSTPPAPGDAALKANLAFNAGEYTAARKLAGLARIPSLSALSASVSGDWSEIDRLPWRNEGRRNVNLDTHLLARARLFGDAKAAALAVESAIAFAAAHPDEHWFALELLLINDAWPALPRFFQTVTNPVLEAEFAYEFFQPDAFARVAGPAWEAEDNPTLRHRLLRKSRALTGADPSGNRSELRVAEQFGAGADEQEPEPDFAELGARLAAELRETPDNPAALLLLGWTEARQGREEAAARWRRRAGWQMLLGTALDAGRVQDLMLRAPDDPHWLAATDLVRVTRRLEPEFPPFQAAVFREGVAHGRAAEAMGWIELGRLRYLSPARSYPGLQGYLVHARRVAELGMHFALARGNAEGARHIMEASLDLLLHVAPEVHGRLEEAGHGAFARDFANAALDRMRERLQAWPRAVETRNNAAWLAAVSRQQVPAALALLAGCEEAGMTLPVHARDTRAELLLQSGRDAEALALAEKNAAEAPGDAYLQRQLERIRAGRRDTPAR